MRISNIMLLLFLCMGAGNTFACSCIDFDIKDIISESKYIFVARIRSAELISDEDGYGEVLASIDSVNHLKGTAGYSQLKSGLGGGDCGIPFQVGRNYIFYTDSERVNICSRSSFYLGTGEIGDPYADAVRAYVNDGKDFDTKDYPYVFFGE